MVNVRSLEMEKIIHYLFNVIARTGIIGQIQNPSEPIQTISDSNINSLSKNPVPPLTVCNDRSQLYPSQYARRSDSPAQQVFFTTGFFTTSQEPWQQPPRPGAGRPFQVLWYSRYSRCRMVRDSRRIGRY